MIATQIMRIQKLQKKRSFGWIGPLIGMSCWYKKHDMSDELWYNIRDGSLSRAEQIFGQWQKALYVTSHIREEASQAIVRKQAQITDVECNPFGWIYLINCGFRRVRSTLIFLSMWRTGGLHYYENPIAGVSKHRFRTVGCIISYKNTLWPYFPSSVIWRFYRAIV